MDYIQFLNTEGNSKTPETNKVTIRLLKGSSITVIYLENSAMNCYKGYHGILKSITNGNCGLVALEAINSGRLIKIPLEQLVLRGYN
jgi:hypothetical protein